MAERRIRDGLRDALGGDVSACRLTLPKRFRLEIRYVKAEQAYARSFYPGARLESDQTLVLDAEDYSEVLRALQFLI